MQLLEVDTAAPLLHYRCCKWCEPVQGGSARIQDTLASVFTKRCACHLYFMLMILTLIGPRTSCCLFIYFTFCSFICAPEVVLTLHPGFMACVLKQRSLICVCTSAQYYYHLHPQQGPVFPIDSLSLLCSHCCCLWVGCLWINASLLFILPFFPPWQRFWAYNHFMPHTHGCAPPHRPSGLPPGPGVWWAAPVPAACALNLYLDPSRKPGKLRAFSWNVIRFLMLAAAPLCFLIGFRGATRLASWHHWWSVCVCWWCLLIRDVKGVSGVVVGESSSPQWMMLTNRTCLFFPFDTCAPVHGDVLPCLPCFFGG